MHLYSDYGITVVEKTEWSFCNKYARNFITFDVHNSSSSHAENLTNDFLVLGEEVTFSLNGNFGAPDKKFSTNFTEAIMLIIANI